MPLCLQVFGLSGRHRITKNSHIGLLRAYAYRTCLACFGREADMADDGAAFLGQTGNVQYRGGPAFKMGRHGQYCTDGDDARAAAAGDQYVALAFMVQKNGRRQLFNQRLQSLILGRSEERRVGTESVSKGRYRCSTDPPK